MLTIVSGGQTGVDRGAMDAAMELGLDFGGWAPKGFRAEDGAVNGIPWHYARRMREAETSDYVLRTRLNVQDSDATLLISYESAGRVNGGTAFTSKVCRQQGKQCVHLRLPRCGETHPDEVKEGVLAWLRLWKVSVLNVAGPRESKAPGIQRAAKECLVWILRELAAEQVRQVTAAMGRIASEVDRLGDQPDRIRINPANVDVAVASGLDVQFIETERHGAQGEPATGLASVPLETAHGLDPYEDDDSPTTPVDSDAPASTYIPAPGDETE